MEIILNNTSQSLRDGATLLELVTARLGDKQNGVAVAVNEAVIPKKLWQSTVLQPNDNILIIKATQGG